MRRTTTAVSVGPRFGRGDLLRVAAAGVVVAAAAAGTSVDAGPAAVTNRGGARLWY